MTPFPLLFLAIVGALISYIDVRTRRIPNLLVTLVLLTGLLLTFYQKESLWTGLWCCLGLGGGAWAMRLFYLNVKKKDALGMGDVKLLGALGWWLQPIDISAFLFFIGVWGFVIGGSWSYLTKEDNFPFAPAIFLGYFTMIGFMMASPF